MSISRRQQLTIHDGEEDDSSTSPEVKQEALHTPTTSSLSSPPLSPGLPPGALNQILARLGNRVNVAQQELLTFNNTLRAVGEYQAAGSHMSRVSYEESGAGLLKRLSSPSVSLLSTPPSSPSLMAQPDSQPSSTVPSLMPSTYPTPAEKIDRYAMFEAEALKRRATSRESRDMSSDVTAEHKTAVTETNVSGSNDIQASLSTPHLNLTPNPTTSSSPVAPETRGEANGLATNSTSDMASNIQQDIKEVANSVQTEYPTNQKPGVAASEETLAKERTIADVILTAVHASHRKTFVQGDVAIVVDESDLMKTLLLPSNKLLVAAPDLPTLPSRYGHFEDATSLKRVFVLANPNEHDETAMPRLQAVDPTQTLNQLTASQHKPITRAKAAADKAKVKKEAYGTVENQDEANSKIDWLKAYRMVFGIIAGSARNWVFRQLSDDARPLLPQIHAVVNIANKYGATPALQPTLELLIKDFMQARTLWKAVADDPLDWITISDAAKDAMVYEEAMVHLVGLYPTHGEQMREPDVPANVQSMIKNKARELEFFKMAVDQELLTLSLEFESAPDKKGKKKEGSSASADDDPGTAAAQTHYQWLRYVTRQIQLLQPSGDRTSTPKLMSFYRSIHAGGDNYLPADELVAAWPTALNHLRDSKMIRQTLKHLKSEASKIVAPLVRSTLQYEQKEELEYLTCVEIDESDIPWEREEEDTEMDED